MDQEKKLPIVPDEDEQRRAAEKAADDEAMRTAIFIGMVLGCLLGAIMGSLSRGIPLGIAIAVIVELILKRRRKAAAENEVPQIEEKVPASEAEADDPDEK